MRAFWAVVVLLAAVGLWFVVAPERPAKSSDALELNVPQFDPSADLEDRKPTEVADARSDKSSADTEGNTNSAPTAVDAPAMALPDFDLLGESGKVIQSPNAPSKTVRTDTRNPSEVVRRIDERTVELDGRYRVTGNGSANDPYVISWELLTSASEFIDLAQGARTAPPWVRLLDGTYVQISGYYSTAVRVSVAKNLLLTLNRWDGCCIGVPPTPFDAIDVDMRTPLPMGGLHLIRFGTFRGQLRVEPVEAATYLLGFYRLEDATFETK